MKIRTLLTLLMAGSLTAHARDYWQQEVNTRITVRLDDKMHMLHGYEEFTYINHSPDTLRYLYIHLWPNAYKNDRTSFSEQQVLNRSSAFYYAKSSERGYIDSLDFMINGEAADYYSAENLPDIARIDLAKPVLPGGEIKVTTPFRVKVPKIFSRLGHNGRAYFISQWFPKPAVYDQQGWHPIPYLDQGEFYSNIGSYDVEITLPKNYVVMATGNCLDESENNWLDSLSKLPLPSDTLYRKSWPKTSDELKTLHYHEDNIHDFAWFADKRYVVRKDTLSIPGNDNVISAYVAFLPMHKHAWIKGTDYLKTTVRHYSDYVGPYPYKTIKAVEGDMFAGGGMEYPTVTIIDKSAVSDLRTVIVHEAGHNWFYGMLATNEREHAWMDEGINTFYEQKTTNALRDSAHAARKSEREDLETTMYYQQAMSHNDQATDQPAANFTKLNYGLDVYYKTALMMRWLEDYMGETAFKEAMHDYFNTWKYKHPYSKDLQEIMQKHTDKPVDWFFDGGLATDKKVDFKVKKLEHNNNGIGLAVQNNSSFAAPVRINAYRHDSLLMSRWSAPFSGTSEIMFPDSVLGWTKFSVSRMVPDAKSANNVYYRSGFHKWGLQLRKIAGTNRSDRDRLFISPVLDYNDYDHLQLGLVFHNLTWPETRFRFVLAPMISPANGTFTGAGSIGYFWYPHKVFRQILVQADAKSFHYDETNVNITDPLYARYIKIAPSVEFTFREPDGLLSTVKRTLLLKGYAISEDYFDYKLDPADSLYKPSVKQQQKYYGLLRYTHKNDRLFNPFSYMVEGQLGADFAKINVEGNLRIDYNRKNKSLYVRAYAGKFFTINNDPYAADRYYLNSTYSAVNDYLYDDQYLGRSERDGFSGRELSMREGGFKIPTLFQNPVIGRSDDWLASLNLKTDLPLGRLPVRLFLDIGTFANAASLNPSGDKVLYDGGVEVYFPLYNLFSVYVPLVMSKDFKDYMKSIYGDKQFSHSIVFTINLQNFNILKLPRKAVDVAGGM
ncbi:M1 family metallopeptidase [Chitinophagaceae bacterium MMS25-I14]